VPVSAAFIGTADGKKKKKERGKERKEKPSAMLDLLHDLS